MMASEPVLSKIRRALTQLPHSRGSSHPAGRDGVPGPNTAVLVSVWILIGQ